MSTPSESLQLALQSHQSGDFERAVQLYQEVLSLEPRNADAHHLLGLIALEQQQPESAMAHFRTAIECNPSTHQFHHHLGSAHQAAQQHLEAAAAFRESLRLAPFSAEVHNDLGNALRNLGLLADAEACYREAVRLDVHMAQAHNNLGTALLDQQRTTEALDSYSEALRLLPNSAEVHFNLGNCFRALQRFSEAISAYRTALEIRPSFPQATHNLVWAYHARGVYFQKTKYYDDAINCYRLAMRLNPDHVESHNGLGVALQSRGKLAEAKACYHQALKIKPGDETAQYNLGTALQEEGDYPGATAYFQTVIAALGEHADSLSALAGIALLCGDVKGASEFLDRLARVRPNDPEARYFRATMLLTEGNFQAGWKEFEARADCPFTLQRGFTQPRWDGSPLEGKTLLLYSEYGFGDTLQFVRYLRMVRARLPRGRVITEVPGAIIPLLTESGFTDLAVQGKPLEHFDLQLPLMSLPFIFETSLETIPAEIPYIVADPSRVARWESRLAHLDGFKVGIHWQGNQNYASDRHRSMRLSAFASLAKVPNVTLISLQKGIGSEQIAQVADEFRVLAFDDMDLSGGAFLDTAAIMKHLDLVITCDSAAGHLAGALGAKVWLALTASAEWRWLLNRDDTPWYPSMRLFRQSRLDDWSELFDRMTIELVKESVAHVGASKT